MKNLRESAIANREASEKAGKYVHETMSNCLIEKVDSWSYDDIEIVGVKFEDEEGVSMQLNGRVEDFNYESLKALEGLRCDVRAKLWLDAEGKALYEGRTTTWSLAKVTPIAVIAADKSGMVKNGVSPK